LTQSGNEIDTLIFDRDGVINEVVIRDGVISSPRALSEFQLLPDFIEFHESVRTAVARRFVVSNQPDVSRKLLPVEELDAMTEVLGERFAFDEIVYCTHDDKHDCSCRKPKHGMITYLLEKYSLEPARCLMIGDSRKDILAGQAAGVTTVYVRRGYNDRLDCQPEFIVDNLRGILNIVGFQRK
jgi:D-glycero-D-manno-heptose 1,7-bisphosphate phosphatase